MEVSENLKFKWVYVAVIAVVTLFDLILSSFIGSITSIAAIVNLLIIYDVWKGNYKSAAGYAYGFAWFRVLGVLYLFSVMASGSLEYREVSFYQFLLIYNILYVCSLFYLSSRLKNPLSFDYGLDGVRGKKERGGYNTQNKPDVNYYGATDSKLNASEVNLQLYKTLSDEVESELLRNKGLWTKLWIENSGDDSKTKLAYLKFRLNEENILSKEIRENGDGSGHSNNLVGVPSVKKEHTPVEGSRALSRETKKESLRFGAINKSTSGSSLTRKSVDLKYENSKNLTDNKSSFEKKIVKVESEGYLELKTTAIDYSNATREEAKSMLGSNKFAMFVESFKYDELWVIQDYLKNNEWLYLGEDKKGNNILYWAVEYERADIAQHILNHGLDPYKKNRGSISPAALSEIKGLDWFP